MNRAADAAMTGERSAKNGVTDLITPDLLRSLRENGAVRIKGALNADEMSIVKEAYELQLANIAPWALDKKTENTRFVIDPINPDIWRTPVYQRMWRETKLVDLAAAIFTTPEVWLWYSQVFFKQGSAGEKVHRTEWHQDVYDPIEGADLVRFWIPLEPLQKDYSLEFIRGTHRGVLYNTGGLDEVTALTADNGRPMPPIPDIEADRSKWDILSWDLEVGDVVAFHPTVIHGGGPTKPNGTRRTLTMLLFGRDVRYATRPNPPAALSSASVDDAQQIVRDMVAGLQLGDPICSSPAVPRLR